MSNNGEPERRITEHLYLALAIIAAGGISLGWIGSRAVDYAFQDVRENSDFRVAAKQDYAHLDRRVENLEEAMKLVPEISESVARIEERLKQWEPAE